MWKLCYHVEMSYTLYSWYVICIYFTFATPTDWFMIIIISHKLSRDTRPVASTFFTNCILGINQTVEYIVTTAVSHSVNQESSYYLGFIFFNGVFGIFCWMHPFSSVTIGYFKKNSDIFDTFRLVLSNSQSWLHWRVHHQLQRTVQRPEPVQRLRGRTQQQQRITHTHTHTQSIQHKIILTLFFRVCKVIKKVTSSF